MRRGAPRGGTAEQTASKVAQARLKRCAHSICRVCTLAHGRSYATPVGRRGTYLCQLRTARSTPVVALRHCAQVVYMDDLHERLTYDEEGHDFHEDADGGLGITRIYYSFGLPHTPYRGGMPTEPFREEWRNVSNTALLGAGPGESAEVYTTTTRSELRLECEGGVDISLSQH